MPFWAAIFLQHQHTEFNVSQLILYASACSKYQNFVDKGIVNTQGNLKPKLVSTLRKVYGRHHDLVHSYKTKCLSIVSSDLGVTGRKMGIHLENIRF